VENKSLPNLDVVFVRLAGAKYEPHGIKWNPVPLLTQIDHHTSIDRFEKAANRHASELVGFTMVGYNTPGYGANEVDENGVPLVMKGIGDLAVEYDVPFVVDAAGSMPVFWPHLKDIGANVMLWSTDKAARAPISGLIIGDWETMVQVRKAMGLGGGRYGDVSSHSKAVFSMADPGRDSIVGLTAVLKKLRDDPEKVKRPIDIMHEIVLDEFNQFSYPRFLKKMLFTKSYAYGGTEINYEQTWVGEEFAIPIFSLEDMFSNTNPVMSALEEMGIFPATFYSGNIWVTPGLGTLDAEDELDEEKARIAVRALVKALEIVCRYSGLEEG
jgi:selenocysteine lyase/cysteine desulfurase